MVIFCTLHSVLNYFPVIYIKIPLENAMTLCSSYKIDKYCCDILLISKSEWEIYVNLLNLFVLFKIGMLSHTVYIYKYRERD